ncbi:MAG: hypothetical protein DHS20C13_26130 [Thermodesulfobacteriota bacterium]|nr:MAG: hypothetical protein DHS20C13_26130 [Thermodesulfobacteriota bacterium]
MGSKEIHFLAIGRNNQLALIIVIERVSIFAENTRIINTIKRETIFIRTLHASISQHLIIREVEGVSDFASFTLIEIFSFFGAVFDLVAFVHMIVLSQLRISRLVTSFAGNAENT